MTSSGTCKMQAGHPAEDVGFTAQLLQALHLRMISSEIVGKTTERPAIVTNRLGAECHVTAVPEDRSQRMLERRASRTVHEEAGRCAARRRAPSPR